MASRYNVETILPKENEWNPPHRASTAKTSDFQFLKGGWRQNFNADFINTHQEIDSPNEIPHQIYTQIYLNRLFNAGINNFLRDKPPLISKPNDPYEEFDSLDYIYRGDIGKDLDIQGIGTLKAINNPLTGEAIFSNENPCSEFTIYSENFDEKNDSGAFITYRMDGIFFSTIEK